MRNARLKYLGMMMTFLGIIITAGSVFLGTSTRFRSTLAEQSLEIIIGLILLGAGLLMWIFIDE